MKINRKIIISLIVVALLFTVGLVLIAPKQGNITARAGQLEFTLVPSPSTIADESGNYYDKPSLKFGYHFYSDTGENFALAKITDTITYDDGIVEEVTYLDVQNVVSPVAATFTMDYKKAGLHSLTIILIAGGEVLTRDPFIEFYWGSTEEPVTETTVETTTEAEFDVVSPVLFTPFIILALMKLKEDDT